MFTSAAARSRSIWCASSAQRCAAGAGAAAGAAAPAGVRALHVEAHLVSKGIHLPKAIVPPQGKSGWSGRTPVAMAPISLGVLVMRFALRGVHGTEKNMRVKAATATCRR